MELFTVTISNKLFFPLTAVRVLR